MFIQNTQNEFDADNFHSFSYLARMPKSDKRAEFAAAIKEKYNVDAETRPILSGEIGAFETRNADTAKGVMITLPLGLLAFFLITLLPVFDEEIAMQIAEGKSKGIGTDIKEMLELLTPRPGYFVTPIIIDINLVVFVAMVVFGLGFISFSADDLLKWGGDFRPSTLGKGELWRLLTSMFLHGGLLHIFSNMFCLVFVGVLLEPVLGTVKYLAAYIITGLAGGIASLWWHTATVSVGASGAIFGLYGVFLALLLLKYFPPKANQGLLTSTVVFIGFNLVMGLTGGVDNAAHIGGLLSGFVIGLILYRSLPEKKEDGETEEIYDEPSITGHDNELAAQN